MWSATDVAREIGVSRRAEAQQVALRAAMRLARREQRLNSRRKRLEETIAGH